MKIAPNPHREIRTAATIKLAPRVMEAPDQEVPADQVGREVQAEVAVSEIAVLAAGAEALAAALADHREPAGREVQELPAKLR